MDFNKEIKKIIKDSGMKEIAFCVKHGLSPSTINKITTGNTTPSVEYYLNFMIIIGEKVEKSEAFSLLITELKEKLKFYENKDFLFTISQRKERKKREK